MRRRLELIGGVLAAAGALFVVQQAASTHGDLLAAGIYLAIAGVIIVIGASRGPDGPSRITWPSRIVAGVSAVVALGYGLLAAVICGWTVVLFDCQA